MMKLNYMQLLMLIRPFARSHDWVSQSRHLAGNADWFNCETLTCFRVTPTPTSECAVLPVALIGLLAVSRNDLIALSDTKNTDKMAFKSAVGTNGEGTDPTQLAQAISQSHPIIFFYERYLKLSYMPHIQTHTSQKKRFLKCLEVSFLSAPNRKTSDYKHTAAI